MRFCRIGSTQRATLLSVVFAAQLSGHAQSKNTTLAGTSWQLVRFEGGDDTILTPDDGSKYTLGFAADGTLTARIDCNRGRGTWTSSGPNQLQFGREGVMFWEARGEAMLNWMGSESMCKRN